jgi:hypothetical protein
MPDATDSCRTANACCCGGIPRSVPDTYCNAVGEVAKQIVPSEVRTVGEETSGAFHSPAGYTFCRADLVGPDRQDEIIHQTANHQVTFLTEVRKAVASPPPWGWDDGLWYKVIVPSVATETTSVHARMRLYYVVADPPRVVDWTNAGKCQRHNICPLVMDKDGDRKNLENCNPSDPRQDRWLAHLWGPPPSGQ